MILKNLFPENPWSCLYDNYVPHSTNFWAPTRQETQRLHFVQRQSFISVQCTHKLWTQVSRICTLMNGEATTKFVTILLQITNFEVQVPGLCPSHSEHYSQVIQHSLFYGTKPHGAWFWRTKIMRELLSQISRIPLLSKFCSSECAKIDCLLLNLLLCYICISFLQLSSSLSVPPHFQDPTLISQTSPEE